MGLRIWCVPCKGKVAAVSVASLRAVLRAAGWKDIRTCMVSKMYTATHYRSVTPFSFEFDRNLSQKAGLLSNFGVCVLIRTAPSLDLWR